MSQQLRRLKKGLTCLPDGNTASPTLGNAERKRHSLRFHALPRSGSTESTTTRLELIPVNIWRLPERLERISPDGRWCSIAGAAGFRIARTRSRVFLTDAGSGFGFTFVSFPITTFQNDAPDGLALVNDGTVVQFLSYEGSFTAVGGPADGLTSTDLGVFEVGTTPVGHSLQLQGTGSSYEDFTWASAQANTAGAVNGQGQTLVAAAVPELGGTLPLLGVGGGLVLLLGRFRRQASKRLAMPNKHCGFFEGQHGSMK